MGGRAPGAVGFTSVSASHRVRPDRTWVWQSGALFTATILSSATFSTSETGTLTYSLFEPEQNQFIWLDRAGKVVGEWGLPAHTVRLICHRMEIDLWSTGGALTV